MAKSGEGRKTAQINLLGRDLVADELALVHHPALVDRLGTNGSAERDRRFAFGSAPRFPPAVGSSPDAPGNTFAGAAEFAVASNEALVLAARFARVLNCMGAQ